jgi:hypothetical protein
MNGDGSTRVFPLAIAAIYAKDTLDRPVPNHWEGGWFVDTNRSIQNAVQHQDYTILTLFIIKIIEVQGRPPKDTFSSFDV